MKGLIVYWTGTGNTEKMAELIEIGMKDRGANVTLKTVDCANTDEIDDYDVVVLGCPSMGAEELEDSVMQPFYDSIKGKLKDKKIALFGSYGWGDGEWMRIWEQDIIDKEANLITGSGLMINETPVGDDEELCKKFGREIIKSVK